MKQKIIQKVLDNINAINNQTILSNEEIAHDLFMNAVIVLGLDTLDDEDNAPYDDIRDDVIAKLVQILSQNKCN